jgi:hypothetical protein
MAMLIMKTVRALSRLQTTPLPAELQSSEAAVHQEEDPDLVEDPVPAEDRAPAAVQAPVEVHQVPAVTPAPAAVQTLEALVLTPLQMQEAITAWMARPEALRDQTTEATIAWTARLEALRIPITEATTA